jgi:thioredoxin reductase/NAD-dependent dihydropyrimidine dehydrogenase PreA subunit
MSFNAIVWGLSFLVVGVVFVPYFVSFRRRNVVDRARKEEAERLGIDRPTAQFPAIDAALCVGCGACVDACPEHDVLGIVRGTAAVINGLKCVGHGRCETACPVGAIKVGLGDLAARADVPLMDPWQETSVPGLFVAGELSGLALVKNAMGQGRKVVERIAQKGGGPRPVGDRDVLDVVIVGAGPAGIAAAASAQERRLRYVALEQAADLGGTIFHYPRKKLVLVQAVDIPLWGRMKEAEYGKEDLLRILEDLRQKAQLKIRFGEKVTGIRREAGIFSVETSEGLYRSRFVILALGRRGTPRKLGVPGEEQPKVMYQLREAESYRGNQILVVGGGDSAVEAVIGLACDKSNRVALSYRREKLVRIKSKNEERIQALFAARRVQPLFNSEVTEIGPRSVRITAGEKRLEMPNDYVFVFAGGDPPFAFLKQIGVRFGGNQEPARVGA